MLARFLSRFSVRQTAPVMLVLPVLLVAGVLLAIHSVQGRAAVERLASQQMKQIHDQIADYLDAMLAIPSKVARANVALLESGRLDPDQVRDWGPLLIEQFIAFDIFSSITWGDQQGRGTWIARYAGKEDALYYAIRDDQTNGKMDEYHVSLDGTVADAPSSSFDLDPRVRPWYTGPRDAGKPTWSGPFAWEGGNDEQQATLGIAYGWPYYDDAGELVGVMDVDLSLQDISRFLSELHIGRTGRAYVVDHDGKLLASSLNTPVVDAEGNRLSAEQASEAWITESAAHLDETYGTVDKVSEEHEEIINLDGHREWVHAFPFTHKTGLHWVVVTVVPESDFTAELAAGERRSAWTAGLVILGTLALGFALAGAFARPIVQLSEHARAVGEGDLDREIELFHARELVDLSSDMNDMTHGLRDRMRMRQSLALAMDVQRCLLPNDTPKVEGLDIAGHSTYCDETGGDYYDYLDVTDLSPTTAVVAVGDVVGHGIAAAMLMATARGILRSRCDISGSLADLLTHMNGHLANDVSQMNGKFMTMLLMTMDASKGVLRFASAGHDPPIIFDPQTGEVIEPDGGGLPLGIDASEVFEEYSVTDIRPGQICVIATDGVWEAANPAGELYGKERLTELIRSHAEASSEDISAALRAELEDFRAEAKQGDDITFVILKVEQLGEAQT